MIPILKDRKPTPSEKRKELRKEKSRAAARCRRGRESEVFDDILAVLPMPAGCREQLDKASVVRLAINYVKLREFMRDTCRADDRAASMRTFDVSSFSHFLLLLDDAGEIVYVTENISKILGLSQCDLFGNSVYDFVHPCDHDDVRSALHDKEGSACALFSRMKCTLLPKGRRAVHGKSALYKVVKFTGRCYGRRGIRKDDASQATAECHLLLTGELIPNPAEDEFVMDESMFMTHHSLDMKMTYYDGNLIGKLGYEASALLGTSLYDYVHASDAKPVEKLFKMLYSKGQISTERYRLLVGGGGYVWVVTQATVVVSKKTNAPKQIVCVHTLLSDVEEVDVVYAQIQRAAVAARPASDVSAVAAAAAPKGVKAAVVADPGSAVDYWDTGIVDATEALFSDLNCDSVEPAFADEPKSDIFAATVSLFKDFDGHDDDWLAGATDLFDDDDSLGSLRPMTPVDLSEGLLVDTSCLDASLDASLDEDLDMCMRAPYIPMCPSSDEIFAGAKALEGGASLGAPQPITFLPSLGARRAARPQALLLPLRREPHGTGDLQPQATADTGSATGHSELSSFLARVTDSPQLPQPLCLDAPCKIAPPSPMAGGTAGAAAAAAGGDTLQALLAQLSHLLSAYGQAPTDAGLDGEPGGVARARIDLIAERRRGVSASGLELEEPAGKPPDKQLLLLAAGQGRPSLKRALSHHEAISAASPAKKKSLLTSPNEGKRSLLLQLLLHGHNIRDGGVNYEDERDNGEGGWLGTA